MFRLSEAGNFPAGSWEGTLSLCTCDQAGLGASQAANPARPVAPCLVDRSR